MHKAWLYCTLVFGLEMLMPPSERAQTILPKSMEQEGSQVQPIPEIRYPPPLPGRALLDEIQNWLCTEFELPSLERHPRVALVPAAKITSLRQSALSSAARELLLDSERDTIATYEDASQTIYLPESWNGSTPREQSILVHEMMHHFQNLLGMQYECVQAREKVAYLAQDRWLARSGHSLAADFQLDPFTLLMSTTCPYLN